MTGDPRTLSAARAGVAQAVAAEPGRLRRCSATALLAFTSAAALAPLLVAGGPALALAALAGVAGNVGSGMLTNVLDRAFARLGGAKPGPADTDAIRDDLAGELRAVLQQQDAAAGELTAGLFDLLTRIGGVEAAIDAAAGDICDNVLVCFRQLAGQQGEALSKLQAIEAGQRRQEWRQRDHGRQIEEMNDRLRLVLGLLADRLDGPGSPAPPTSLVPPTGSPGFTQLAGAAAGPAPGISGWQGGAEIMIGDRVYLLHDEFLEERYSPDPSVLYRQARGLRLVPRGGRDDEHAWLRQAHVASTRSQPGPGQASLAARAALAALRGERDLLARLRSVRGLPRVTQLVADGRTTTLVLGWPATRSGAPCDTLSTRLDGEPTDSWRMSRLFAGWPHSAARWRRCTRPVSRTGCSRRPGSSCSTTVASCCGTLGWRPAVLNQEKGQPTTRPPSSGRAVEACPGPRPIAISWPRSRITSWPGTRRIPGRRCRCWPRRLACRSGPAQPSARR